MAWVYMIPQVGQILEGKTNGLTLALWLIFIGYLLISLSLAILAYKEQKDKLRLYTIIIFTQWTVFFTILFGLSFNQVKWSSGDTTICIFVLFLSIMTVVINGLKDPISRGWLAVWCKGVPQLWTAYVIWQAQSAQWLPLVALIATNATALPRFIQVCWQGRQGGWDRATKGLFIGELGNILSWGIVNIIWIVVTCF